MTNHFRTKGNAWALIPLFILFYFLALEFIKRFYAFPSP
jgi:hypothetical protein